MSRKRQKTAEVLARMDGTGEYQVVYSGPPPERMYRTIISTALHFSWSPNLTNPPSTTPRQYWNHVDTSALNDFNKVPEGTSGSLRQGNKISVSKVHFKVHFHLGHYHNVETVSSATTLDWDPLVVRCVLLLDTQSSLGDIDLIEGPPFNKFDPRYLGLANTLQSFISSSNTRFRILADEVCEVTDDNLALTTINTFTNVSGTGTLTTSVLVKKDFGHAFFNFKHTFRDPLALTYGLADGNPRDHRFLCLWTINQDRRFTENDRAITTSTSARMYYTDA